MSEPTAAQQLIEYIDSAHLDPEYVETLIDKIASKAIEGARDRMVKSVWKQMWPNAQKDRQGLSQAYVGGWDDATATAVDNIKNAWLHTCGECEQPIGYTGSRWAHETHPDDNHDARPVR
jgi:hypothetical protein